MAKSTYIFNSGKGVICLFLGRIRSPGEVRAQKSCCHQQSCCQSLQSFSCGFALGVAFGDF